jgi:hypothetical protein
MSPRVLEGPRTMTTMIPQYDNAYGVTGWPANLGWQPYGLNTLYAETYLDLSPYDLDDLTFAPRTAFVQDPGMYLQSNANNPFVIVDIISQERLDINAVAFDLSLQTVPGMLDTKTEPIQIMFGNLRVMVQNTTMPGAGANLLYLTSRASQFGSGEPTAVSKLWVYRILHWLNPPTVADTLKVPASRFVLSGTVAKESDLAYLMRLKRSYELAQ